MPNAAEIYARWPVESARVKKKLGAVELRYGPHSREVMDVFHARDARGCLVFFHGGYWRAFSKEDFAFLAEALVEAGITVAMPSYPLCPEASLKDIGESAVKAVVKLWRDALSPAEKAKLVICGHSAGGYLTAALFANDWAAHGLPPTPFCGGLSISGVFELEPLINTTMNTAIGLDSQKARALSLGASCPHVAAPLRLCVGEKELPRNSTAKVRSSPVPGRKSAGRRSPFRVGTISTWSRSSAVPGTPVFNEAMTLFT